MLEIVMPFDWPGGMLALAPQTPDAGANPFASQMLMILVMVGIFYFILFRPMRKRQKKLQEMINNLKRGDKIVTTGGIRGTVMGISDHLVQLRIADHVTIEISRNAVAALQEGGENPS